MTHEVSLQILNVSLSQIFPNYPVRAVLSQLEIRQREVLAAAPEPGTPPSCIHRRPGSTRAPHSLLWETGPSHLPKPSGQNLRVCGLGAGAAPAGVDPASLEWPSTRHGSRSPLEGPAPGCCNANPPAPRMVLEPGEKAKDKMATSSNIVYSNLLFSDGLNNTVIHQPGISHSSREPKRRKLHLRILLVKRKMELLKPVSSKNRFKSAFEKAVFYS